MTATTLLDYLESNPITGALRVALFTLTALVAAAGGWRASGGDGRGGAT